MRPGRFIGKLGPWRIGLPMHSHSRRYDGLVLVLVILAAGHFWSCAPSASRMASAGEANPGDQALERGIHWYQKGCLRKAMDQLQAAHEQYCLSDHPVGVARSLTNLGNVYRQSGDPESALLFFDAAIAVARRCDDQQVMAQTLVNKAALLIDRGDCSAAEVLLDEAQLLSQETGSVYAMVLNHRAVLQMKARQYRDAAIVLDQADVAAGDASPARATVHYTRGRLMMRLGHYTEALDLFQQALEIDRRAGFSRGTAADLAAMTDIYELMGEDETALNCLERSVKIYALLEDHQRVLESLDRLQALADRTGCDIRVTLHMVNQWLAGEAVDAICR